MKSGLKIGEKDVHDFALTHLGLRMTGSDTTVACPSRERVPCVKIERESRERKRINTSNGCNLPPRLE